MLVGCVAMCVYARSWWNKKCQYWLVGILHSESTLALIAWEVGCSQSSALTGT